LAELVQTPSVNPMGRDDVPAAWCGEARVAAIYERELRVLGVPVERHEVAPGRWNVIGRFTSDNAAAPTILLEAHMDTVPVDGMTVPPFSGTIRDGRLSGRGACDVKGGGAAMFGAFREIVQHPADVRCHVILAYTVDEEHNFLGVQHLAKVVTADFAIVAEPTELQLINTHKGVARYAISTTGVACDSSTPHLGVNAIHKMGPVLIALEQYAGELQSRSPHPQLGPATLSVGTIQGGASANIVPERCTIAVDRRLLPGETAEAAQRELAARLPMGCDIHCTFACPALAPSGGEAFVKNFCAVLNQPHPLAVAFGTDASTLQEAGVPCVVFGPGSIAQAHTKAEWIELSQVDAAARLLVEFVRSIA